ncbi:ParA family protein [Candidatus Dojkabacteria bacterium]|nr:ParA family protein [Candidatus Dojkabacteria bacterium]
MPSKKKYIFSISNQKGGVGKTTTAINLGSFLADQGKKVLLIDLDPQANLSSGVGFSTKIDGNWQNANKAPYSSIYDVLTQEKNISEVFVTTDIKNLFLVPSHLSLAGAEIELASQLARESLLKKAIENFDEEFDYIFIDSPPSLGLLTINSLVAANKVIVPIQCEYFALEGLGQLIETVRMVKNLNSELELGGVILTMFDARTNLATQVVDEVRKYFKDLVFETVIPRNVRLSEAPSYGKPINLYDTKSSGASSYKKLAKEFSSRFV